MFLWHQIHNIFILLVYPYVKNDSYLCMFVFHSVSCSEISAQVKYFEQKPRLARHMDGQFRPELEHSRGIEI